MGGGSKQSSDQQQLPGSLSPVTATLWSLFGGPAQVSGNQFVPTSFGGPSAFTPESFGALPGLLQNMPATATESFLTSPEFQQLGAMQGLASQGLLAQGAGAFSDLLAGPQSAIAQARRGFEQETVPTILERAPGFSSSDLQRELTRAGVDLETNVSALREANLAGLLPQVPGYAQALGSNLLDQASQALGFGQVGREFLREVSPSGDAFRVLTALQSLTTPALTTQGFGGSKGKSTQVL